MLFFNNVFFLSSHVRLRLDIGNKKSKTIYMFHVNKASGSWMTKSKASSLLVSEPSAYTKDGTCKKENNCARGTCYTYYNCQVRETDLRKTMAVVKPKMHTCGLTKGIVKFTA